MSMSIDGMAAKLGGMQGGIEKAEQAMFDAGDDPVAAMQASMQYQKKMNAFTTVATAFQKMIKQFHEAKMAMVKGQ